MRTLFLNLASHEGSVASVDGASVRHAVAVDHRIDDAGLVDLIEQTLHKTGWTYEDLDRIACVVGPGGFTSLRSAVAAANTIAWARKIPSVGIHLSDVFKARMTEQDAWWLHSTKKTALFARGFGKLVASMPEAMLQTLDEFLPRLQPGDRWTGELIPEHRALIDAKKLHPARLLPLAEVLPRLLDVQRYEEKLLQPWYGREW